MCFLADFSILRVRGGVGWGGENNVMSSEFLAFMHCVIVVYFGVSLISIWAGVAYLFLCVSVSSSRYGAVGYMMLRYGEISHCRCLR